MDVATPIRLETVTGCHDPDVKRIQDAFFADDDIGALIRCHYEAEKTIETVLSKLTSGRSDTIKGLNYFGQKVDALYLIGVNNQILEPLRLLNSIRNRFAHKGSEEISEANLAAMQDAIRPISPRNIEDFEIRFHGKRSFSDNYKTLNRRQKFIVCVVLAFSTLSGYPDMLRQIAEKAEA